MAFCMVSLTDILELSQLVFNFEILFLYTAYIDCIFHNFIKFACFIFLLGIEQHGKQWQSS